MQHEWEIEYTYVSYLSDLDVDTEVCDIWLLKNGKSSILPYGNEQGLTNALQSP